MSQLSFIVPTHMFNVGNRVALEKIHPKPKERHYGVLGGHLALGRSLILFQTEDHTLTTSPIQSVAVDDPGDTFTMTNTLIIHTQNSTYRLTKIEPDPLPKAA